MSKQSDFLAKKIQKRTKNHPLVAVRSQISLNHLKNQPRKKIENSNLNKWLRNENDLMFWDTCLTAKACSNPFTEGCTNFQN